MEQDILAALQKQEKKIDAIYASAEKTRRYFMWTLILSVALFVLPLVGLLFMLPSVMSLMSPAALGL
jgi:type IV secretory pathway component VirB8